MGLCEPHEAQQSQVHKVLHLGQGNIKHNDMLGHGSTLALGRKTWRCL